MKVVGFAQLRNELTNGNLENWFKCMQFCEKIYIFDQNSDDGSREYYKKFENTVVIESPINDFENEISCKAELLNKLLHENPDTDWIFWIDGDTILDGRLLRNDNIETVTILNKAQEMGADSIVMGHHNLWRSDVYYRIDSDYDWFHRNGRHVFWRNNGKLKFIDNGGLHQPQFPRGIEKSLRIDRDLIHRGFATDEQIVNRYNLYKSKGQKGSPLERLIDESTLEVKHIKYEVLPEWYEVRDNINPTKKERLKIE